jgi:hypothetical protein
MGASDTALRLLDTNPVSMSALAMLHQGAFAGLPYGETQE